MLRTSILAAGIFAAVLAVLIFSGKLPIGNSDTKPQGEVVVWGTIPETGMNGILQAFNPAAKTYRVTYKEVREDVFAQTLLEGLANGTGPDMILAPHQVILSQVSRLYPFPVTSLSEKAFKDTYVDGASLFFSPYGAVALPVSIESLVLFYNRTLFAKHGFVNPPAYWDEVSNYVPKLTISNTKNQFVESGIALGAPNTPYAKDILMAVVNQVGQTPVLKQYRQDGTLLLTVLANTPTTEGGDVSPLTSVARFFTQFADATKSTYSWNQFSGNADDQFVAEKLAMYVGYSGELESLRARNPRGEFEMTYLPQTRGYNTFTTGARMYGIATLRASKNLTASLNVEAQFAGAGVAPSLSSLVGGVPALRAYSATPGLNDVVARSMLVARGWYDSFPKESSAYVSAMLSDIINNRYGVPDAAAILVSRLSDLYAPR